VELYPLDQEASYTFFGMRFRSVIKDRSLRIFNRRNGVERHQMDVPFDGKPEAEILADIEERFDRGIDYPFSRGLRFSQVVDERFLFLRDDRLEIYSDEEPYLEVTGIQRDELREVLRRWFSFDLDLLTQRDTGG